MARWQRTLQWHRWAGLKMTLSSVPEPGFQKPPHSTYSAAAGANPAAEPQAPTEVGASSCTCSFGGLSFSLEAARRMAAGGRQLRCQVTVLWWSLISHGDSHGEAQLVHLQGHCPVGQAPACTGAWGYSSPVYMISYYSLLNFMRFLPAHFSRGLSENPSGLLTTPPN